MKSYSLRAVTLPAFLAMEEAPDDPDHTRCARKHASSLQHSPPTHRSMIAKQSSSNAAMHVFLQEQKKRDCKFRIGKKRRQDLIAKIRALDQHTPTCHP